MASPRCLGKLPRSHHAPRPDHQQSALVHTRRLARHAARLRDRLDLLALQHVSLQTIAARGIPYSRAAHHAVRCGARRPNGHVAAQEHQRRSLDAFLERRRV
jgi:hypothetical protein